MATDTAAPSWAEVVTDEDGSAHTTARMSARSRRIEVFTGPERRRRWSIEQKRAIVAESYRGNTSPAAVARKYDLSTGQLYTWRRQLTVRSAPALAHVEPERENPRHRSASLPRGAIEIVLPDGTIVRTDTRADEEALRRIFAALRR